MCGLMEAECGTAGKIYVSHRIMPVLLQLLNCHAAQVQLTQIYLSTLDSHLDFGIILPLRCCW
jgi:hypothetical protein